MDARTMAEIMMPAWMLGATMLYLVKNSEYSSLLRIDPKGLLKFGRLLLILTVFRYFYLNYIAPEAVIESIKSITVILPWQTIPGVFWEDACHALPLVILGKMMTGKKWYKWLSIPLIAGVATSFGLGHAYEGVSAIFMMTAYVPFTMKLGEKYGFGTVMIAHIFYDLLTLFTFKMFLGV